MTQIHTKVKDIAKEHWLIKHLNPTNGLLLVVVFFVQDMWRDFKATSPRVGKVEKRVTFIEGKLGISNNEDGGGESFSYPINPADLPKEQKFVTYNEKQRTTR
jgi:hypothetical protein